MSNDSSEQQSDKPKGFPARGPHVPWGPLSAVVVAALTFFGAQLIAGLVLSLFVLVTGISVGLAAGGPGAIAGQFYFVLLSDALILLAMWLFLRSRRAKLQQLGFSRRPALTDVGYALLGYAGYFALLIAAIFVVGNLTEVNLNQKQELGFDALFSDSQKLMALVALVILPPIVEEIVFRGFLFTGLRTKMKFVTATIITSLLFASPHLLASSEGLLWIAGVDTLVLSFVLCYLREKTGALWAPIAVHAIKNAIAYMLLISTAS